MSRRSSAVKKIAEVTASVLAGLTSFVSDHAEDVATMLDCEDENEEVLVTKLRQVMGVNSLSAEAMLARFFSQEILSRHCQERLGLSGKGGVPVLAARIAKAWAKPSFLPLSAAFSKKRALGDTEDDGKDKGEQEAEAVGEKEEDEGEDGAVSKRFKTSDELEACK